jgi:hypothetical protein
VATGTHAILDCGIAVGNIAGPSMQIVAEFQPYMLSVARRHLRTGGAARGRCLISHKDFGRRRE